MSTRGGGRRAPGLAPARRCRTHWAACGSRRGSFSAPSARFALLGESRLTQRLRFLVELPVANLFDVLL